MTRQELLSALKLHRGCSIVSFDAETIPAMRKTGNPFLGARKLAHVNGMIGFVWEHSVQRHIDPKFVAGPRKWGIRLAGSPLVEHRGEWYLETLVRSLSCDYFAPDGTKLDETALDPWLVKRGETLKIRDYALANLRSITYHGKTHLVT